ncbi:hypothetical protein M422DRAFT_261262, partial [Sphaerobolus stellatus SS14]
MFPIPSPQLSSESIYQAYISNEWDNLAEVVIPTYPIPSPWLDQVAAVLESHGTVVHRLRVPSPLRPMSVPHITSLESRPSDLSDPVLSLNSPLNLNAVVFGSKVIEVPPCAVTPSLLGGVPTSKIAERLFNKLHADNVEVIRWSAQSTYIQGAGTPKHGPSIDAVLQMPSDLGESPSLYPADVVILSANLFITRLSAKTNNKGLEYLWHVLEKSPELDFSDTETGSSTSGFSRSPERPIPLPVTTTLIVN